MIKEAFKKIEKKFNGGKIIKAPGFTITSDDVLDIKKEIAAIKTGQVKSLNKKKKFNRSLISKSYRNQSF